MSNSAKENFSYIYEKKYWGEGETVSGSGSTMAYTEILRQKLPKIYENFNVKTVLDAPCGDFNWMRSVVEQTPDIQYIGADIVPQLVKDNHQKICQNNVKFMELDITQDKLPRADIMIVRDCLFHLPNAMIRDFIYNFLSSDIPLLFTSSYYDDSYPQAQQTEIQKPGDWFYLNLMNPPWNFPPDVLYLVEDWIPGYIPRRMYLWHRNQILRSLLYNK